MAYNLFDVVTASEALPEFGIHAGMTGTVVEVYQDGAVEVEFCDQNGVTLIHAAMQPSQIALADIRSAA